VEPAAAGRLAAARLGTRDAADLRRALATAGSAVAARFTWQESARAHLRIYTEMARSGRRTEAFPSR
jgi:hypothetical protein